MPGLARPRRWALWGALLAVCAVSSAHAAPPPEILKPLADLASRDAAVQESAVRTLGERNDPRLRSLLEALREGSVYVWRRPGAPPRTVIGGEKSTIGEREAITLFDAYGREPLSATIPLADLEEIPVDRALRRVIKPFVDALASRGDLFDGDPARRRAAATRLGGQTDPAALLLLREALGKETERWTRYAIEESIGLIELAQGDAATRAAAASRLGALHSARALDALRAATGVPGAVSAVRRIERWGLFTAAVEIVFTGLSLSSILLLMALGLAIVFGLMGVINMAHGELMALGAYATYSVQNWFAGHLAARYFDYYFLAALPISFLVAAAFGLCLERGVIRFLYGRPLETLLLTWGVSLIIQQGLRQFFGAANVDVRAPKYLSGGVPILAGVQFPYNRVFIIGLAAVCVLGMYGLLFRTSAGIKIRAVMQNREISSCLGIRARRVDAGTFALGAGLAGLAGSALTQIGNVGPELGQNYIVDSFMVVVTGGVGKLAGSIAAALGLGGFNKAIEPVFGAVYGKVLMLVLVILFLQRRPSGLFAMKGRAADA